MSTAHYPQSTDTALTAIDAALVATASEIGSDVYQANLHTSPWLDLTKQGKFEDANGKIQQVLLYDRSIPTTDATGNNGGVTWYGTSIEETSNTFDESLITGQQPRAGAPKQHAGLYGGDTAEPAADLAQDQRSYLQYSRKVKQFTVKKAEIIAPKLHLEDLRYAVHRQQQVSAIMRILTEATAYVWENRYRDEYERMTANVVFMLTAGTKVQTTVAAGASVTSVDPWEGEQLSDINQLSTSGIGDSDVTPTAMISNKILDRVYTQMIRKGASKKEAYGMESGRPVYGLMISSEASYFLRTESDLREDTRHNQGRVSELLAPLGVDVPWRGYYHMVDDLAPRYNVNADKLERVHPYTVASGITADNPAYETATVEVAYLHHRMVCESQIPNPFTGVGAAKFDPQQFAGKFGWYNIQSEENRDRQIGYFAGTLASATKPIRTEFGYTFVYKRDTTTPAA